LSRTDGQELAYSQLSEICEFSDGSLSIVSVKEPTEDGAVLELRVSLSTRHHDRVEGGLPIRKREPVLLSIPANFPRDYPSVDVPHKRFAKYSHVQWMSHLCLYRSSDIEWSPKDGMFGFIERLNKWFGAAARDELDPDDAPLHPPVIYNRGHIRIVIRENAPIDEGNNIWLGSAALKPIHHTRFDLTGWHKKISDVGDDSIPAISILLGKPFPIEYPATVRALVDQLGDQGIEFTDLYLLMQLLLLRLDADQPLFVVLGTPMRRRDPNGPLRQHLAIWRIDDEAVKSLRTISEGTEDKRKAIKKFVKWSFSSKVEWCRIDEAREEVTLRRDSGCEMEWMRDKSILLLGCGALGSHTADYIVRAGASSIKLVDYDVVSSGVLTRQQFSDSDIGKAKATVCKDRLLSIRPKCVVETSYTNLKYGVLEKLGREYDLIIDATASRAVAEALEQELQENTDAPPILSMSVSAKAEIGRVILRSPKSLGGPKSIIRSAQLVCNSDPKLSVFAKTFWPKPGEVTLFQPEPGCSEPTFQGSCADMASHAAGLLNAAMTELALNEQTRSLAIFLPKPRFDDVGKILANTRLLFSQPEQLTERNHGYVSLVSKGATATINAEINRSARVNGQVVETGGLLFGEIDDNLKRLWIDQVTGPPPDSLLSPKLFVCGTSGSQERAELQKERSGGASRFVGIWHTHPVSHPRPSDVDLAAMYNILIENDRPPRHTVMLIVGHSASDPDWALYIFRRSEIDASRWIINIDSNKNDD